MKNFEKYSKPILRISLSLVFLYFGFSQIISPSNWISYVPSFMVVGFLSANNLVMINATLELILGTFLLFGIYTKFSSIVLSIHLFLISISIGFNPVGIRDLGLSFATLSIFLNGIDNYCLDKKFS